MKISKFLILVGVAMIFSGGAFAHAATRPSRSVAVISLSAPVMAYLKAYGGYSEQFHYVTHNIMVPSVWLYNPAGKPVGLFAVGQSSQLAARLKGFPRGFAHAKPLTQEPGWDAMKKILQRLGGKKSLVSAVESHWTAVLLNAGDDKSHQFLSLLEKAARKSTVTLRIVSIRLKR